MSSLTKNDRKEIRDLIARAYTKEISQHLNYLAGKFKEWQEQSIDCWELCDLIHGFHNGASRELFSLYHQTSFDSVLIQRALLQGLIQKENISKELFKKLNLSETDILT